MKEDILDQLKQNKQVTAYINKADEHLQNIGFTEHSFRHANLVSKVAQDILIKLDYSKQLIKLAGIAGYLHDIGNLANRHNHGHLSALLASHILEQTELDYEEIAVIVGAIGNHDEDAGEPVNKVAAALIIADKSDVHWTRVRNNDYSTFDIHDRVNYAVQQSLVKVDQQQCIITLDLEIDTEISTVMEYFEIFLTRMVMCRQAAEILGCNFQLIINQTELL
ncbi:MAG: HD domain-containing protein [Bacillota bacterium]